MKNLGAALLIVGVIMTLFTGFTFVTKKKVVDVGPLEINKEEKTPIYWSPITGGVIMAIGIVVLISTRRKS